jgi:hypothetical protein
MGYRSDVTVAIYPDDRKQEGYDALKVLMGTTFKDAAAPFEADMEWHDDGCELVYNIVDIKWYESDPEVKAFLHMLNVLANEVKEGGIEGYNYEMVRLGEESDDIEFSNGGEFIEYFMSVSRVVDMNI